MKLSIIVPIYNVEAYLRRCLDSLVNQNVEREVLLINDGSPDHSQDIIDEYVSRYPDIFKGITKKNGGLGDTRNLGASLATGEYLLFIDSDDFYEDHCLEGLIEYADEKKADLVCFDYFWYYADDNKSVRKSLPSYLSEMNHHTYLLSDPSACFKLIRRELYLKNNIQFPSIWYEDLATTLKYSSFVDTIEYYEKPLYNYRQRVGSITSKEVFSPKTLHIMQAMNEEIKVYKNTEYHSEIEYLSIFQLAYFSSFRFLRFKEDKKLIQCLDMLEHEFPEWRKNRYYQSRPIAFKLYCECLMRHLFGLCRLMAKARGQL